MKRFWCAACDTVWNGVEWDHCPHCASLDILDDGLPELPDFDNGHFEGNFPQQYFQDDSGE